MGRSIGAPEKVRAAERRQMAVELRKLGLTYQKIADQLGVSKTTAYKLVTSALQHIRDRTAESAEDLLALELARLDEYQLRAAQEIKAGRVLPAIDRALRIMERRAKLLGLDAPTKLSVAATDSQLIELLSLQLKSSDQAVVDWAAAALHKIVGGVAPPVAVLEGLFESKLLIQ